MKLTKLQRELALRIRDSKSKAVKYYAPPGLIGVKGSWYIENPYSDEDGRVCSSLEIKGGIKYAGDGDYELTPLILEALA